MFTGECRWGQQPHDDAVLFKHHKVAAYLQKYNDKNNNQQTPEVGLWKPDVIDAARLNAIAQKVLMNSMPPDADSTTESTPSEAGSTLGSTASDAGSATESVLSEAGSTNA